MKCPNCGAEIANGSKVCEFCGTQINYAMQRELEQLNKKGCPKCGSSNITFTRENQGEIRGRKAKKVVHTTIGYCKDCGYTWTPETEKPKKKRTFLWILGWLFIFPLPLTILMLRKKEMKPGIKYGVIAAAWIIYLILILVSRGNNAKKQSEPTSTQPAVQSEAKEESSAPKQENSVAPAKQESSKPEESKEEESSKPAESSVVEKAEEESSEESSEEVIEEDSEEEPPEEESSEEESSEEETVDQALIRPEIKEAIDSYETFIDEYCEFLETYDSSDLTMLAKYAELVQKELEMSQKFEALNDADLTEAEALYYSEVSLRCSQKLLAAASKQ